MDSAPDRRRDDRYTLPPMYSRVLVRPLDCDEFIWDGHAYDISKGGVRFELDQAVEPGTPVAMRIDLPRAPISRSTDRRAIFVIANVVWIEEDDEPGPVRMAAVFSRFAREDDERRLFESLQTGRYSLAA